MVRDGGGVTRPTRGAAAHDADPSRPPGLQVDCFDPGAGHGHAGARPTRRVPFSPSCTRPLPSSRRTRRVDRSIRPRVAHALQTIHNVHDVGFHVAAVHSAPVEQGFDVFEQQEWDGVAGGV